MCWRVNDRAAAVAGLSRPSSRRCANRDLGERRESEREALPAVSMRVGRVASVVRVVVIALGSCKSFRGRNENDYAQGDLFLLFLLALLLFKARECCLMLCKDERLRSAASSLFLLP